MLMAQQRLLLLRGNTPVVGGEGTPPSVGRALAEVPAFATAATDAMRVSARYQWGSIATRTGFERCMSASGATCLSDHTPTAKVTIGPGVRSFLFGAGVAYAMGKGARHILLVGAGLTVMSLLDRSAVAAVPPNRRAMDRPGDGRKWGSRQGQWPSDGPGVNFTQEQRVDVGHDLNGGRR